MGRFLLIASVLLVFVATAFALKCYVCSGTEDTCSKGTLEGSKDKYLKECGLGADKCIRTWLHKDGNTAVGNDCTNQLGCDLAQTVCDNVDSEVDCKVGCCSSDECNAGSPVSFSIFLMTVCSALGLALLM
ncbi:hypothetical protein ACROYT_G007754 [Oculina patagonica]